MTNTDASRGAIYGQHYMVEITYNTDYDGREIDPGKEKYPRTLHGPFDTEDEAVEWMDSYPADTDVHDMVAVVTNRVEPAPVRVEKDRTCAMRTYLVAVVAANQDDLQKFLLASPHGPSGEDALIDCWWIAEDDREDGSDCDSAIFVPRGAQEDMSSLLDQHFEYHQERWDEEGYEYAATDVGGAWYVAPEFRR